MGACKSHPRFDQRFIEFLDAHDISYVDSLKKHGQDFRLFRLTPEEYVKRYYIGHYKPRGNNFFAFSIKDEVVSWLDHNPLRMSGCRETYRRI